MASPILPVPGSIVVIRQQRWRVERVRRSQGITRLDVVNRERRITFLAPFDRPELLTRRRRTRRVRPQQAVARLAGLVGSRAEHRTLMSALGARLDILPYQLEPALAFLAGHRRVLVADEVGLGKTIQAGLAIGELVHREPGAHVLVLVPAALQHQWTDELAHRFGIVSTSVNQERLDHLAATGAFGQNAWHRAGVWVASLDFVKQAHVVDSLPARPWDMLVIDEAHEACGDSARHHACLEIARRSRQVLLLTATPHSGDPARFDRLTHLGRLDRQPPADRLTIFRRTRAGLGIPVTRKVRWRRVALAASEGRLLGALADYERYVLRTAAARHEAAELLLSVFRKRALSTAGAFRRSVERRLDWLGTSGVPRSADWVQPSLMFNEDELGPDEVRSLMADTGVPPEHERSWLRRLLSLAGVAARDESKVTGLARLLVRTAEPVVVFTEFRDSLEVLVGALRGVRRVARLHGGLPPAERSRELARFESGEVSVLAATDVASQGLNLQGRARWVISLELPWNPARLEQRAGRVDRIGQRRPVHVTLMVARHQNESGLLSRLAERILLARRALGPDVLQTGLPDAAAIRNALLSGSSHVEWEGLARVAPGFQASRRWSRAARGVGRQLQARRVLVGRWRAAGGRPSGVAFCDWRRLHRLNPRPTGPWLVFLVPITDGLGGVMEEAVIVVQHLGGAGPVGSGPIDLARHVAASEVVSRARRLRRQVERRTEDSARLEVALTRRLVDQLDSGVLQVGLFDRRALASAEAARSMASELRAAADARIEAWRRRRSISIGRPELVLILGATT